MASKSTRAYKNGVKDSRLTDKQRVFVAEYLADSKMDAANAARKAGYANPGTAGAKLLGNPLVSRAIGKALGERLTRCELESDLVLRELAGVLLRDPIGLVDDEGRFHTNLHDIPEGLRKNIDGFKVKQRTDMEGNVTLELDIKLIPRMSAIELAMKHFGLLVEKKELKVSGQVDIAALLAEVERPEVVDSNFIEELSKEG